MAFLLTLVRRRWLGGVFVAALVALAVAGMSKLRTDMSIELSFPKEHPSRIDYDHYRKTFAFDDAQVIVLVEDPQLFSPAGLARVRSLEETFRALPEVALVQGPGNAQEVRGDGATVFLEKLFPPGIDGTKLEASKRTATTDAMFRYGLAHPDGRSMNVAVTLRREIASVEEQRLAFMKKAEEIASRHVVEARASGADEKVTISGLPIIRPRFTVLVGEDMATIFPLSLVVIFALLYLSFRSVGSVFAAVVTILVAVQWSLGFMGAVGIPMQVMTQVVPTICMIISVSDTVHIVNDARTSYARGTPWRSAVEHAIEESAWPCLLTEITIAAGFASIALTDITVLQQFGLVTAGAMILTWLANVTVLPLVLSFVRPTSISVGAADGEPVAMRGAAVVAARFIAWVDGVVTTHPRRVATIFLAVLAVAAVGATHVRRGYKSYDDLKPNSPLLANIRYLEDRSGGSVPLAIHVEPLPESGFAPGGAMLEPKVLRFLDDVVNELETKHGDLVKNAGSHVRLMKKAHALLIGEEEAKAQPLPESRSLAVKELNMVEDRDALRDVLSSDHDTAAIVALTPDIGSERINPFLEEFRPWLDRRAKEAGVRARVTGIVGVADGIYDSLVGGLLKSLAGAIVSSFVVFMFVLRSWRLALIALVPNLSPLLVTLGSMAALGIQVKPGTVVVFSITLVIADDDTIQFLSRFRDRLATLLGEGVPDAHAIAVREILGATGLPMFITASAVSLGFLTLNASQFMALHHLGTLLAVSLASAVFADLFMTPVLLLGWKPMVTPKKG